MQTSQKNNGQSYLHKKKKIGQSMKILELNMSHVFDVKKKSRLDFNQSVSNRNGGDYIYIMH